MRNRDSIEKFYKERPDLFEGIDLLHAKIIIKTPWALLEKVVDNLLVFKVRMKYIGEFYPSLFKARYELSKLKISFQKNNINHKRYFEKKLKYEKFIKAYCEETGRNYEEFIKKEYRLPYRHTKKQSLL